MPVQTQMQVRRGTASSWTSTNPTLAAGELGFETDTGKFKIGTGSSTWTALPYAGGGQNTLTTYQYTATAGQTTFSGADINSNTLSYTAGAVQVYLNGALLQNTVDYAASTGTSVVLTAGAGLGDSLTILSLGSFTVSTDIPKSTLTAKGSIVAASGAATPANLSVGANDTVLMADSSTATGLKWATPAGAKSFSLIGSTAMSGNSTLTISGISGIDELFVTATGWSGAAGNAAFLRLNAASTGYYNVGHIFQTGASYTPNDFRNFDSGAPGAGAQIQVGSISNNAASTGSFGVRISGCNTAGIKVMSILSGASPSSGNNQEIVGGMAMYNGTSAISSVTIFNGSSVNFDAGTLYVYGAV